MPYVSRAQQMAFHAKAARGDIKPSVVSEFDQASKGMKLPQHAGKGKKRKGAVSGLYEGTK